VARDPIVDVWGELTPFGRGEAWPTRIDQQLDVDEAAVERWVQSACVLCSNGCGLDTAVAGQIPRRRDAGSSRPTDRETRTQIKWLKSQVKEAVPQALVAGTPLQISGATR
jgi:hypothetical protein